VTPGLQELLLADADAWRDWLNDHHLEQDGIWLVLAKKHAQAPTRLAYAEALEEALCYGWIDGQVRRRDEGTFSQRFTPRRPRSPWSKRNVAITERLRAEGRLQPAGVAQVERAVADGRWEAAYAGAATIEVPPELAAALAASPAAAATFARLNGQNRYAVLYRITTARTPSTRARRVERLVGALARNETPHPQSL
jgi:uncharacterized protein YdeI (YjbR/CyaY-like superfamily)